MKLKERLHKDKSRKEKLKNDAGSMFYERFYKLVMLAGLGLAYKGLKGYLKVKKKHFRN